VREAPRARRRAELRDGDGVRAVGGLQARRREEMGEERGDERSDERREERREERRDERSEERREERRGGA